MLSKIKAIVPESLISLAKKTPKIPVAIVCANHSSTIESAKAAINMNLIDPIFIGQKEAIKQEATNQNWDISDFPLINTNNDNEASIAGAKLAKENKIPIISFCFMSSYTIECYLKFFLMFWFFATGKDVNKKCVMCFRLSKNCLLLGSTCLQLITY